MKKIIVLMLLIVGSMSVKAQFPTTDSLRAFINRYIRNSAVEAFQNLRLNTALIGMTKYLDSAYGGQVVSFTAANDSTARLITLGGDTLDVVIRGAGRFGLEDLTATGARAFDANNNTFKIDSFSNYTLKSKINPTGVDRGMWGTFELRNSYAALYNYHSNGVSTRSYGFLANSTLAQMSAVGHNPSHAGFVQVDTVNTILEHDPNRFYLFSDSAALININGGTMDFRIRTLPETIDTTQWKPVAIGPLGQIKKVPGWPGGGGGSGDIPLPNIQVAPGVNFDPTFVVDAFIIPYPTNAFSHGVDIIWGFHDYASGHNSSFFDTAYGAVNGRLTIRYPTVKNVLGSAIGPDESFAAYSMIVGPTVGTSTLEAAVYQARAMSVKLTGDGAGNWTKSGLVTSSFDVTAFNTGDGGTSFNITTPIYSANYDEVNLVYNGTHGYQVKRVYSGLGAYNARFILLDAFGNPVTDNPTSADEIGINNAGMYSRQINMNTYSAGNNDFMGTFTNWWVGAKFECWLVASPLSTTSALIRWQPTYPSATNYKIYRSTSLYGARTLIHTGTSGSYTDTGLSSATQYFYHMVAVIGGVDTYITYFKTNTR
jgi:hypothetical protein